MCLRGCSVPKVFAFFLKSARPQNRVTLRRYTISVFPAALGGPLSRETSRTCARVWCVCRALHTARHAANVPGKRDHTPSDHHRPPTDHRRRRRELPLVVVVLSPLRNDSTSCRRARARRQPDHHATAQPRIALRKVQRHPPRPQHDLPSTKTLRRHFVVTALRRHVGASRI